MNLIPTVIEQTFVANMLYDIYSRLLKDRIIMISGPIDGPILPTRLLHNCYSWMHKILKKIFTSTLTRQVVL